MCRCHNRRLLLHELFDSLIVVVNYGVFPGGLVLEHEEPVKGEHLTVKDEEAFIQGFHLQTGCSSTSLQGLLVRPP